MVVWIVFSGSFLVYVWLLRSVVDFYVVSGRIVGDLFVFVLRGLVWF